MEKLLVGGRFLCVFSRRTKKYIPFSLLKYRRTGVKTRSKKCSIIYISVYLPTSTVSCEPFSDEI